MQPTKIMIFDCGGTLLDNESYDFVSGLEYLYNEVLDCNEPYNDFLKVADSIKHVFRDRNYADMEISFQSYLNYFKVIYGLKTDESIEDIEYKFSQHIYKTVKVDGIVELLEFLQKIGVKLYLFSNSILSVKTIIKELDQYDLSKYFIDIQSSSEHLFRKPSFDIFEMYVKKFTLMGYSIDDITYVGNDYDFDISPSVQIGINAIYKCNENRQHLGYYEIKDFKSLLEIYRDEN